MLEAQFTLLSRCAGHYLSLACRYEKAAAQEETAYQQQRRRLYAEVEEEKERLAVLAQQQRAELDQRARELAVSSQTTAIPYQHVIDLVYCRVLAALNMVLCAHKLFW